MDSPRAGLRRTPIDLGPWMNGIYRRDGTVSTASRQLPWRSRRSQIAGGLTRPLPGCPGRRRPACGRPATNAGARRCTTRLSNTHGTAERRILYEFHPWSGQEVAIDRVFAKGGVSVAHCRLSRGAPPLEVPLWMFDRQACSAVRGRERPHVDIAALEALAAILSTVVGDADLRSSDRGQGADHAPFPPEVRPVGSVRSSGRRPTSRYAAVAQSAGPGAAAGDGSDGPHAAGTPRRPGRGSGGRDRPGAPGRGER